MIRDIIIRAFQTLGKPMPESFDQCLYRNGHLDSAELMQLLLELELETGKILDIAKLMNDDISISRISTELETDKI